MTAAPATILDKLDPNAALAKEQRLLDSLRALDSVFIAFSGGADSAYLAWAAHQAIGARSIAITAISPSFSRHDRAEAEKFVTATGIRHEFIETTEFEKRWTVLRKSG